MTDRIRVALFAGGALSYGGTERNHERLAARLDRSRFDPYLLYWPDDPNNGRLEAASNAIGADRLIPFNRSAKRGRRRRGYPPLSSDLPEVVRDISPDIFHVARSGYREWPLTGRLAPLHVETNIFGFRDRTRAVDRSIAISTEVADRHGGADVVLPLIVPPNDPDAGDLREDLGIPADAVVCGRIGRPANFDPIGLVAFEELARTRPNLYYVIVAPSNEARRLATRIPRVVLLPPTNDDFVINRFFNTLDVFLHYRSDGESFGVAIGQALTHGIPVVSHVSREFNAQRETIGEGGVVAHDLPEYTAAAATFVDDPRRRSVAGAAGRRRARDFQESVLVPAHETLYAEWLAMTAS